MKKYFIIGVNILFLPSLKAQMTFHKANSQEVILYEHANFTGQSRSYKPGVYLLSDFNDMASSVKVPAGMAVVIYEHANASSGYGTYTDLLEDCADLTVYDFNDKISYVSVFLTARQNSYYLRGRKINNQFVAGHWERARADGGLPNNSPPATLSSLQETKTAKPPQQVDLTVPVFRVELRIVTGRQQGDDEDKEVYVKMNDNSQPYFLDYGPDDFELGSDKRYDIISPEIKTLNDIKYIEIGVKGDDVWGIEKVELYLNNSNVPVFRKTYSESYRVNGTGDYPRAAFYGLNEIHTNSYWLNIPLNKDLKTPPVPVPYAMIQSMVESMVGNQMHQQADKNLSWGNTSGANTVWGLHVEGERKDGNTLHFDLDLEYEIPGTNPEIDVDFDIVFTCNPSGSISLSTENVKIGCEILGLVSCERLISFINAIMKEFGINPITTPGLNANPFSAVFTLKPAGFKCRGIQVSPVGDVLVY